MCVSLLDVSTQSGIRRKSCLTVPSTLSLSLSDDPEAAGGRSHRHALQGSLSPGHQVTERPGSVRLWCSKSAADRLWLWQLLHGDVLHFLLWYDIWLLLFTHWSISEIRTYMFKVFSFFPSISLSVSFLSSGAVCRYSCILPSRVV